MKLDFNENANIDRFGTGREGTFTIQSSAKAFRIISDNLYSDKIRTIIRELSTNAYDSHVAAGCPEKPFDVHLPTVVEPYFMVRDYGTGLSEEQMFNVYTKYFMSTKDQSNDQVGCLGLGSKTPFIQGDSFTTISYYCGVKSTYDAFINEAGVPGLVKLNEEETSEPNGLEVSFPVATKHIQEYQSKAIKVYRWFKTKPNVNLELTYPKNGVLLRGTGWKIYHEAYNAYVDTIYCVQGCVSYPIPVREIQSIYQTKHPNVKIDWIRNSNPVLFFEIGEVDIQPSREGLQYNEKTRDAILAKIETLIAEIKKEYEKEVSTQETFWAARIKFSQISKKTKIGQLNLTYRGKDLLDKSSAYNSEESYHYFTENDVKEFLDNVKNNINNYVDIYNYESDRFFKMEITRTLREPRTLVVWNDCGEKVKRNSKIKHHIANNPNEFGTYRNVIVIEGNQTFFDRIHNQLGNPPVKKISELESPPHVTHNNDRNKVWAYKITSTYDWKLNTPIHKKEDLSKEAVLLFHDDRALHKFYTKDGKEFKLFEYNYQQRKEKALIQKISTLLSRPIYVVSVKECGKKKKVWDEFPDWLDLRECLDQVTKNFNGYDFTNIPNWDDLLDVIKELVHHFPNDKTIKNNWAKYVVTPKHKELMEVGILRLIDYKVTLPEVDVNFFKKYVMLVDRYGNTSASQKLEYIKQVDFWYEHNQKKV